MMTLRKNTLLAPVAAFIFALLAQGSLHAQNKAPKPFSSYLKAGKNYKGAIGAVIPPEEIKEYMKLVRENAKKNPEWFKEYSAKAKPGRPLPFHKNLGITEKQYQEYLAIWGKREFKEMRKVGLRFEESGDKWRMLVTGEGARISLLKFDPKKDVFVSPNGILKRIEDIDAEPETILGAWKGAEWKFEEETGLGKTSENIAIGNSKDGKFGFLVYRLQDLTTTNRVINDVSIMIRFELK